LTFLLLWQDSVPKRHVIAVSFALASSVGYSIWVTFVFALFLAVWTVLMLYQRRYRQTAALCAAGALSILFALPYLRETSGAGSGASVVQLTVRAFSFAALVPTHGLSRVWRLILVNGSLLPFNYLLEFGLFFVIARLKWKQVRMAGGPMSRQDLAMAIMAVISTLICTFLCSIVIGNNDLGWRGFLVAQFVLLVWAIDLFGDRESLAFITPAQKQLLVVFFALGFAGTVTDLAVIRLYPLLADRGVVPPLDWMSPDRDLGHRIYAARTAYEWLKTVTPSTASVQANPEVVYMDTFECMYGDRRTAASDKTCQVTFGGDANDCRPIVSNLHQLFPAQGKAATFGVQDLCGKLGIDVVVAQDTDSVWSDRTSWVWKEQPIYSNNYLRLFGCRVNSANRN
jgi:hypothetical protein